MKPTYYILSFIFICFLSYSCKKLPVNSSGLVIEQSQIKGIPVISWPESNIEGFKNIEVFMSPINDFHKINSLKTSIFTSNDNSITETSIPNILIDTLPQEKSMFIQMQIHLQDRSISSNVIEIKGNSIFKLTNSTFILTNSKEKYMLFRNNSSVFKFTIYHLDTKVASVFTSPVSYQTVNWRSGNLADGTPVLINFDSDITILDANTFQEIKKIPRGSRTFGACKIANHLLYCNSKDASNQTKILIYHVLTGNLVDSFNTNYPLYNSNNKLNISEDTKFLYTFDNQSLNRYSILNNGALALLKSKTMPSNFLNSNIEITNNEIILELDNEANIFDLELNEKSILPFKMPPTTANLFSNTGEHFYLFQRLNNSSQISLINIFKTSTKEIISTLDYSGSSFTSTSTPVVIIDNNYFCGLFHASSGGNTFSISKHSF